MIEVSVILPLFRAEHIAWLALEGYCRQTNVTFEWELIIAEEQNHGELFGRAAVIAYKERLKAVGCKRIKYIPLKEWVTLGAKHTLMAKEISETSRIWVHTAADYYPAPQRLSTHYRLFTEGVIAQLPTKSIYYDIHSGRGFFQDTAKTERKDGIFGRAMLSEIMRQAPPCDLPHGLDYWAWQLVLDWQKKHPGTTIVNDDTTNWQRALGTHGLNNLTQTTNLAKGLASYPVKQIAARIPAEVWRRIRAAREKIKEHGFIGHGTPDKPDKREWL